MRPEINTIVWAGRGWVKRVPPSRLRIRRQDRGLTQQRD